MKQMEIDIKMVLKEMGWEGLNCVNLGRDRDKGPKLC